MGAAPQKSDTPSIEAAAAPPDETSRWVAALPDVLRGRLAAVGLIDAPERAERLTLKPFLGPYLDGRTDIKPSTRTALAQTVGYLTEFFGPDKPLRNIRPGDADEWRLFLIGKRLADNTVRRRCGAAKQFFRAAVRKGLVAANPFADLKAVVQGNPSGNTPSAARRRRRCWMPARMPSGG